MFYLFFYQVLQIDLRVIMKNNICTYDPLAFRHIQVGLCKTVTYDGLALNRKHGLHIRH